MRVSARRRRESQRSRPGKRTQPTRTTSGLHPLNANQVLHLQATAGNHAVQGMLASGSHSVQRSPAPKPPPMLSSIAVNYKRVTVPPKGALGFKARKISSKAENVTLSIKGINAAIAAGTKVNSKTGVITLDAAQTGGSAKVEGYQKIVKNGITYETTQRPFAEFHMTAIPGAISSTTASDGGDANLYGGDFTHTFTAPGGNQAELERAHINEKFPTASGTKLKLTGSFKSVTITVNKPNAASAGWDLDAGGQMVAPDEVTWGKKVDARPFVKNASNPSPAKPLPQESKVAQQFRNLRFPKNKYDKAAVATTTHRRAFEEQNGKIKAITEANNQKVIQDYEGPTVFRNIKAAPASLQATGTGLTAPLPATSQITVDAEGKYATPKYSIQGPTLGSKVDSSGEFTAGTKPGTVTVRAGDRKNYDEVKITLTKPPAAPKQQGAPKGSGTTPQAAPGESQK